VTYSYESTHTVRQSILLPSCPVFSKDYSFISFIRSFISSQTCEQSNAIDSEHEG